MYLYSYCTKYKFSYCVLCILYVAQFRFDACYINVIQYIILLEYISFFIINKFYVLYDVYTYIYETYLRVSYT